MQSSIVRYDQDCSNATVSVFMPFVEKNQCTNCVTLTGCEARTHTWNIRGRWLCVSSCVGGSHSSGCEGVTGLGLLSHLQPLTSLMPLVTVLGAAGHLAKAKQALGEGCGHLATDLGLQIPPWQRRGSGAWFAFNGLDLKMQHVVNIQGHFCTVSTEPLSKYF